MKSENVLLKIKSYMLRIFNMDPRSRNAQLELIIIYFHRLCA